MSEIKYGERRKSIKSFEEPLKPVENIFELADVFSTQSSVNIPLAGRETEIEEKLFEFAEFNDYKKNAA